MGIPHLAWPLRLLSNGAFSTFEQDSSPEVAQCVAIVLATPVGSRVEVPDFGSPRSEFGHPDPAALKAAVTEWEPRADLDLTVIEGLGDVGEITEIKAAVTPHV